MRTADQPTASDIGVGRFVSLAALREAHTTLIERRREQGETPALINEIITFVERGVVSGALLDADADRRAAQSLLDFWSNLLYRAGKEPPDATLADFDADLAPSLSDDLCPYLGLDAFREDDSALFFGRQRLVADLVARLSDRRLLAIVGPSGSGKSSLVRGGLIPALKGGALPHSQGWRYLPPIVPTSEPLSSLARVLRNDALAGGSPVVLVVDQFEEVFTLCESEIDRQAFIMQLLALVAAPDVDNIVVLTMRGDFEAFVARVPDLQELFELGRVQVTPLSAGELREAIEQPALQIGLKFEAGVVEALLQDILGEPAALPLLQFTLLKLWEKRERNRITLDAYRRVGGGRLALARSADDFYNALIPEEQVTARRILLRMVRPGEGLEVTSSRVRRAALYRGGEDPGRVDRVLGKLIQVRLVRLTEGETPDDTQVEVAHEALVRNWPTFVEWLEDERAAITARRRLETRAAEWVRLGKGSGGLLDEIELPDAERWLASPEAEEMGVDASVPELIVFSRAAIEAAELEKELARQRELAQARAVAEAERRRAEAQIAGSRRLRRLAVLLAGLTAIALLAVVLAGVFGIQASQSAEFAIRARATAVAERQAADTVRATAVAVAGIAETQSRVARASELAVQAQSVLDEYPQQSLLLAAEALNISLQHGEPVVPVADQTLRGALSQIGGRVLIGHSARVTAVAFGPNGHYLATGSEDTTARLWDLTASDPGANPVVLRGHQGPITSIAVSPDAHWVATGSEDTTARLWDLRASDPSAHPIALHGHMLGITSITISPDGHYLATASLDDTARLWDLTATDPSAHPIVLHGHTQPITSVTISPDGRYLATASADGTARLWNLSKFETAPVILVGHLGAIIAVAFSPDGHYLATGSADTTVEVWDLTFPDPSTNPIVLSGHTGEVTAVAFTPDGSYVVSGSTDKTARVWNLAATDRAGKLLSAIVLPGHADKVTAVAISPDAHFVITGSADKTAHVWDLTANDPAVSSLVLRGHDAGITAVAFSRDGRRVVTGSEEATARLWDLAGTTSATGTAVLPSDPAKLIDLACQTAGRNLSIKEWQEYFGQDEAYRKTCAQWPMPKQ